MNKLISFRADKKTQFKIEVLRNAKVMSVEDAFLLAKYEIYGWRAISNDC